MGPVPHVSHPVPSPGSGLRKDHGVGSVELDQNTHIAAAVRLLARLVKLSWILRWHLRPPSSPRRPTSQALMVSLSRRDVEVSGGSDTPRACSRDITPRSSHLDIQRAPRSGPRTSRPRGVGRARSSGAGSSSVTSVQARPPAPGPWTARSRCWCTTQSADTRSAGTFGGLGRVLQMVNGAQYRVDVVAVTAVAPHRRSLASPTRTTRRATPPRTPQRVAAPSHPGGTVAGSRRG
jgi:hypothetical protein